MYEFSVDNGNSGRKPERYRRELRRSPIGRHRHGFSAIPNVPETVPKCVSRYGHQSQAQLSAPHKNQHSQVNHTPPNDIPN